MLQSGLAWFIEEALNRREREREEAVGESAKITPRRNQMTWFRN